MREGGEGRRRIGENRGGGEQRDKCVRNRKVIYKVTSFFLPTISGFLCSARLTSLHSPNPFA